MGFINHHIDLTRKIFLTLEGRTLNALADAKRAKITNDERNIVGNILLRTLTRLDFMRKESRSTD